MLKKQFIGFLEAKPKLAFILAWILLLALMPGLSFLKEDYSFNVWFAKGDPNLERFEKFEKRFGNDDLISFAVYSEKGFLNFEALKLIDDLTDEMWQVTDVTRVDSITNTFMMSVEGDEFDVAPLVQKSDLEKQENHFLADLRKKITGNKLLENYLISEDHKMTLVLGKVKPSYIKVVDNEVLVEEARNLAQKYQKPGFEIHVVGTVPLTHAFKEITNRDIRILIPLVYFIFSILLFFIYRSFSGVFIPYVIIIFSVLMMVGTAGYFGDSINSLSIACPNILLTVAIADAIHLLTVYFIARRKGFTHPKALHYSLDKNFYPTLLTSLTTSVGFFSFAGAKIQPVEMLGVAVGIGVLYAWLNTYLLIPFLLNKFAPKEVEQEEISDLKVSDRTYKFVDFLLSKKRLILLTMIGICALTFKYFKTLEIDLNPLSQFPNDYSLVTANERINQHFKTVKSFEIMIDTPVGVSAKDPHFLKKLETFQNWLDTRPYMSNTVSIIDILKDLNQKFNQDDKRFYRLPETREGVAQQLLFYSLGLPPGKDINDRLSLKDDAVRITGFWTFDRSKPSRAAIKVIDAKMQELGLQGFVTGKVPLFHELTPYVVETFVKSFKIAFIAITLILILTLASFKIGLLALIPNLFPLLCGGAIYAAAGEHVDIASVLVASVCLGIAVDDSIHFLFEYSKNLKKNINFRENMALIFTTTIPSLVNTTVTIALGFGSFVLADYHPNAKFGVMVAVILVIALLADIFVLPAILAYAREKK